MARPPNRNMPGNVPGRTSEDDVRRRAYEIYQDRAKRGAPGNPVDDWVRAERELRTNLGRSR